MSLDTFFHNFDLIVKAPTGVQKIRELIFQLAIEGRLLEQKRSDSSASELFKTIQVDLASKGAERKKKQGLPSTDTLTTHPFKIPSSWIWTNLGSVSSSIQYGYTASADLSDLAVRLLRITDIQDNSVHWDTVPGCQISQKEVESYRLNLGDLLIARTGGTIGKSFLVSELPFTSVFASYLIRIVPNRFIFPDWIKLFADSPLYWSQLRAKSMGTGQPNVNGTALASLRLSLPPRTEQERIVSKVKQLMSLCDRLENLVNAADIKSSSFVAAVVSMFFATQDTSESSTIEQELVSHVETHV